MTLRVRSDADGGGGGGGLISDRLTNDIAKTAIAYNNGFCAATVIMQVAVA